ncbi:MAG: hypothetical protein A2Y90_01835 [Chloroflexi bacterium RBG_13_52_12]|nr:MAG: hypothetical protein A2Y90_01835 [Chloroflexi bacterium RBG_13_52_12]
MAAIYVLGYWLKYEKSFPRAGGAIIFVGAMAFGAALFLVGQQYHLPIDDPRLMTWWFIGVIPVAYFTRSRAILTLAILAALWGLGYKTTHWLTGISWAQYAFYAFYLVLGLVLYGIGAVHVRYERMKLYTPRYLFFGLVLLFGVMYVLSFKGIYRENVLVNWHFPDLPTAFIITFHITAALAIIGVAWCLAIDIKQKQSSFKNSGDLLAIIVFTAISYMVITLPFTSPVTYTVIFNVLLFAGIIGLIFLGYFRGNGSLVNIALFFFGLDVIGRYFDFAWKLLPRSIFFIIGGLILLGGGILLERLRRKTLERMRAIEVSDESET